MSTLYSIVGFILGFGLVYFSIPPLIRVSVAKHLYDTPNERKASKVVVPTIGGVAIFIGFILSTIIATDGFSFAELKYLIAAVIVLFFLGLNDDLIDIQARKKLLIQLGVAIMLIVVGGFRFTSLHGFLGFYEISYPISFAITLFTMIALINAFNLIDGIDGLASGISILISGVLGFWFLLSGHPEYGIMSFCLTGSLAAFFIFNVFGKTNKIFMGDNGSLVLGVIMAIMAIKFNEFNINQMLPHTLQNAPAISIGIFIIPVIDTLMVILIRASEGRSPFVPDMNHLHHQFLKLGNSHLKSTSYIVLINMFFITLTFFLHKLLDINSLLIAIITLGFTAAWLPRTILQRKETKSAVPVIKLNVNEEAVAKRSITITDPLIFPAFRVKSSNLRGEKLGPNKELAQSAI
jgi:UDP-N-acetylmuramyl pentapeptide phosphotransferase/UDP-N-acetylglucosamine-1-phosphate transferase